MSAIIAYATSSGTTKKLAREVAEGIKEAGLPATAVSIEYLTPDRIAGATLFGVGSPVHFYREAFYMTQYLERLPPLEGKRSFVFCGCGMDRPGETLNRLGHAVTGRGGTLIGSRAFRCAMSYMPLKMRGLGNPDYLPDEEELERARQFGMAMVEGSAPHTLPAPTALTRAKARLLAQAGVRRSFFPGVWINPDTCTDYGTCLSRCAVEGIDRSPGEKIPHITDTCVRCLECIGWCPRQAIEPDSAFKEKLSTLWTRLGIH